MPDYGVTYKGYKLYFTMESLERWKGNAISFYDSK